MGSSLFSPMAIDAIGEIFNISLGSSATAVSNMLARRVDITTPTVSVVSASEFSLGDVQPAIGVKIDYVAGLSGSNIMLLKRSDVRAIVDILMGTSTDDEDFQINELNMSAICEVMNQMMGAASTAMSDFLSRMVNISTPKAFEIESLDEFIEKYFPADGMLVVVRFQLSIEDAVESEFMSALSMDLVRELLQGFGIGGADVGLPEGEPAPAVAPPAAEQPVEAPASDAGGGATLSQEEIERLMASAATSEPAPAPEPAAASSDAGGGATLSQEEIERLIAGGVGGASEPAPAPASPQPEQPAAAALQPQQQPAQMPPMQMPQQMQQAAPMQPAAQMQQPMQPQAGAPNMMQPYAGMPYPPYGYPPMYYGMPPQQQAPQQKPAEPKMIKTSKPEMPTLDSQTTQLSEEQESNLDLLMTVPVDVAVEIGRTRRRVKDILNYTKGSLVVLDRLAGDRADLYVNGKCIAKGDIVVVDDSFGLRIAEIIEPLALEDL